MVLKECILGEIYLREAKEGFLPLELRSEEWSGDNTAEVSESEGSRQFQIGIV